MLSNTIAISPNDKWKLCDYHILPPVADQISVGYYKSFTEAGIKASLELYHKWINNQVEYKDGTDFTSPNPIETQVLQGKQHVNGIEVMIEKNAGKATGWISYCYSRSLIRVDGGLPENQINRGIEYPANYDRPHSFNLVINYKTNRRLSESATFVYTTGRPFTFPVSIYYAEGQQILNFSNRNEFRLPDYARLDLSVNLEGNLLRKKPIHSFWTLNLYNVLGRKNVYSVYFDGEKGIVHGHQMSIFGVPILTLSWNYKFGNYLND
jgi:TonB dependent receptor.